MASTVTTLVKSNSGLVQFVKFGIVGVGNTLVDWAVFYLLVATIFTDKVQEPSAKAIAFVVAVLNSYLWNSIWTFRREYKEAVGSTDKTKNNIKIFIRFFIVSLIGWGVNYFTFKYTRFNLDQAAITALIAASGAAILWNFFANKLWTYKK